ncbi:MAG: FAD-dependent oxidoreductase [Candidatus Paceibacterota bacterium]|jgi:thioredoxin-disulfide reductase
MGKTYDLIIIGGGPAGITAGIYSARQKLKTLLLTKSFGGQITRKSVPIENYPGLGPISSTELIKRFEQDLKNHPIEIETASVSRISKSGELFNIISKEGEFSSKAVIIASGADPRPLEIPGEKEFIGKGVSYCVACDGPIFVGKDIAVAGGGNSAFEAALSLSNYANKVYIIERGDKVRADETNQKKVKENKKIELITGATLKKVSGSKFVEEVSYEDNNTKKEVSIKVSGLFVEIGSQPATAFVKDLVEFNEKDEIVVDPKNCKTKTEGIWAAGDVNNLSFKQIVIAAGQGAIAAMDVSNYLSKL